MSNIRYLCKCVKQGLNLKLKKKKKRVGVEKCYCSMFSTVMCIEILAVRHNTNVHNTSFTAPKHLNTGLGVPIH